MIIKNIFKYFYINKLTYIFILLCLLMAKVRLLFFVSFLLIVHEMGHFFTAKMFGIKVDKIYLYPFGGIAKFYLPLNYSSLKELIILINGPIFQEIAKMLLLVLFKDYEELIITYHYSILIFNLLPIYPLDGGKLVCIILSLFNPYKKSMKISIVISYFMVLGLLFLNISNLKINTIIVVMFLLFKIFVEEKKTNLKYENFLLERYINQYKFKYSKIIDNTNNFYKNKRHLIKIGDTYALEKDYLRKKYQKR